MKNIFWQPTQINISCNKEFYRFSWNVDLKDNFDFTRWYVINQGLIGQSIDGDVGTRLLNWRSTVTSSYRQAIDVTGFIKEVDSFTTSISSLTQIDNCTVVQPLNRITLGQTIFDSITQMIPLSGCFYTLILSKWDLWNLIPISGWYS